MAHHENLPSPSISASLPSDRLLWARCILTLDATNHRNKTGYSFWWEIRYKTLSLVERETFQIDSKVWTYKIMKFVSSDIQFDPQNTEGFSNVKIRSQ